LNLRATRQTAIVVCGLDQTPSFASLAPDELFARFALIMAVEGDPKYLAVYQMRDGAATKSPE